MKATEILSAEHRVIEQVLDCLERMAGQAAQSGALEEQSALDALEFFRTFADKCHHGKEEAQLFPAMEAKGFPRHGGPTGVMILEHEQGRQHVRAMAAAVGGAAAGDRAALESFAQHAQAFIALLREHIGKEDHCLFSMANQSLTAADQEGLLAAFEKVEHEDMGAGTHEKFLNLANELADKFGVPRASAGEPQCCGHH
jgi:hemerythrin-like domain-containing protein